VVVFRLGVCAHKHTHTARVVFGFEPKSRKQTFWRAPENPDRINLGISHRLLESAGWWQKLTRRAKCNQCAQCRLVKEPKFGKDFYKIQLGRGGKCLSCKEGI